MSLSLKIEIINRIISPDIYHKNMNDNRTINSFPKSNKKKQLIVAFLNNVDCQLLFGVLCLSSHFVVDLLSLTKLSTVCSVINRLAVLLKHLFLLLYLIFFSVYSFGLSFYNVNNLLVG